jgi:hypothetical protein
VAFWRRRNRYGDDDRTAGGGVAVTGRRAVGSGLLLIARLVMLVVWVIVAVIVAAILLRVLEANASNDIVKGIHDVGKALVGPFKDVFEIKNPKTSIAVNWGLAAVVWLVIGGIVAGILRRIAVRSHPDV